MNETACLSVEKYDIKTNNTPIRKLLKEKQ
jgi:hypothetical protein